MNRPASITSLIFAVLLLYSMIVPSSCLSAVAIVDTSMKFQTIEGFGGGFVFGVYPYGRACKDELYDSLFNKAGINIVRIGNRYNPDTNNTVDEIPMIKEIRQKWPSVKVMLTSWSPPASLKSNNSTVGVKGTDTATIKKVDGLFAYDAYGDYWLKTARHFLDSGAVIDWLSIQNEPDLAPQYDGCVFMPVESSKFASYGKALNAVYTKIATLPHPIPLVGPDLLGIGGGALQTYLSSPDMHPEQLVALCHHLYTGPDSISMHSAAASFPSALLYMTEYLINEVPDAHSWFYHALAIQQSLVTEGVSMYDVFTLTYRQASTHCLFSLDATGGGYAARPMYYAFKHFSKSIHRGWRRVGATIDEPGVKISAFRGPGDSLAIVVINGNALAVSLSLSLPGSGARNGAVYQTTETKKYVYEENVSGSVTLDPMSITTFESPPQVTAIKPAMKNPDHVKAPRLIKAITRSSGDLCVFLNVPPFLPYELSLFKATGKKISSSTQKSSDLLRHSTHVFKGPFAKGFYFLRLESRGRAEMQSMGRIFLVGE